MIVLELTQGRVAIIDDIDAPLAQHKWSWLRSRTPSGYAVRSDKGRFLYLHRVVLGVIGDTYVDHKDGDGLNCRRENLRVASNSENLCNRGRPRNNHSGFKGVAWDKTRNSWRAEIQINKKRSFIGRFSSAREAAAAYDKVVREAHGSFAVLNFPEAE